MFKAAARRAVEAGYDGLELHAAHGYMLLGSFLAPQRNRRTDEYRGDSTRGRVQVVLDALAAIRSEIGDAVPITLRISGYERVAGGRPIYETARVAPELVAAGVDAFHVSGGVIDRLVTGMVNAADDGDELNVGAAAAVKQVVDVPVIAVGRIHDPVRAEKILADGRADFVAMGRPLLADPNLARKLQSGQAHRVRKCISCENCIDAMEQRFSVDCAVNPRTGKERRTGGTARRARQARGGDRRRTGRAGGSPCRRRTRAPGHAFRARRPTRRRPALGVRSASGEPAVPALPARRDPREHRESGTASDRFGPRCGAHRARRGGGGHRGPRHGAGDTGRRPAARAHRAGLARIAWRARRFRRSGLAAPGCSGTGRLAAAADASRRGSAGHPRLDAARPASRASSAATSLPSNSPSFSRPAAGWRQYSSPARTSLRKWATSARPNTWIGSTASVSPSTSAPPSSESPAPPSFSRPLAGPAGSCPPTASCWPERFEPRHRVVRRAGRRFARYRRARGRRLHRPWPDP